MTETCHKHLTDPVIDVFDAYQSRFSPGCRMCILDEEGGVLALVADVDVDRTSNTKKYRGISDGGEINGYFSRLRFNGCSKDWFLQRFAEVTVIFAETEAKGARP